MSFLRGLLLSGALGLAGGLAMMGIGYYMGLTNPPLAWGFAAGVVACLLAAYAIRARP